MAVQGGRLSTLGITPSFINNLAQQTAATGVTQALGQVWQGSGQSFLGSAGQALTGNLASSAVNVAINSALGTQVSGPGGFPINTGGNFLASTVTPFVTSSVAAGINQNIQKSLQSAGPFGNVLSGVATGLVDRTFGALTGGISNLGGTGSQGQNYRMFPGGGGQGEASADYGGKAYTLTDVTFSLRLANQGPQADGDAQTTDGSKIGTTIPVDVAASSEGAAKAVYQPANDMKSVAMGQETVTELSNKPAWKSDWDLFNESVSRGDNVVISNQPDRVIYRSRETQKLYEPR